MNILITLSVLILVPSLLKFTEKTKIVAIISPIALAYLAGILLSNSSIFFHQKTIIAATEISIALSICLYVLSSSFDKFDEHLKPLLKSFILGILSLLISIFIVYSFFNFSNENYTDILGMLVGLYVGGTPNLNAIGMALEVPNESIILVNTADITIGGVYFLLLITIIKPLLSFFLPPYKSIEDFVDYDKKIENKTSFLTKFKMILKGLFTSILILAISYGFILLAFNRFNIPAFLILLTSISIIGAQLSTIKKILLKFETADFLLLIFSFGIGLQIDINALLTNGIEIYMLVGFIFLSTILIHIFLAWLTKTDVDTLMISSTAALYGPAFIGPIAKAINNRNIVVYGIALGLLGYILGNYLGLLVAWILTLISS